MSMRSSILAGLLAALVLFGGGVAAWELAGKASDPDRPDPAPARALEVQPEKAAWARGETVAFDVVNAGTERLEGTADVAFLDANGDVVGALMVAQVMGHIEPGERLRLAWEPDAELPAGAYTIRVNYAGLEARAQVALLA